LITDNFVVMILGEEIDRRIEKFQKNQQRKAHPSDYIPELRS